MGLEVANFIEDLNALNPAGGDVIGEGDNHIRLMKAALKATLPGLAGRAWRIQNKGVSYTVVPNDNMSALRATTTLVITLPSASTAGNGFLLVVIASAGQTTLQAQPGETVGGAQSLILREGHSAILLCNGGLWLVFSSLPALLTPTGTGNVVLDTTPTINTAQLNSATVTNELLASGTGALQIPAGTTAQRPAAAQGKIRKNLDTGALEIYDAILTAWAAVWHANAEASLASAASVDLASVETDSILLTGAASITSFGSGRAGLRKHIRAAGAFTLVHNATSMILPGAANILAAVGDTFEAYSLGGGNWVIAAYQSALVKPGVAELGIGAQGQAWVNFNSTDRQSGVSYQNTTGRPIMVAVTADTPAAGGNLVAVTIDSVERMSSYVVDENGSEFGERQSCQFIVPVNSFYSVQYSRLYTWSELR